MSGLIFAFDTLRVRLKWKYFDSPNRKLAVRAAVPLANGLSVFQTDWKELCVVRLSPGRDSKLNVGDSINFRTEEFGQ